MQTLAFRLIHYLMCDDQRAFPHYCSPLVLETAEDYTSVKLAIPIANPWSPFITFLPGAGNHWAFPKVMGKQRLRNFICLKAALEWQEILLHLWARSGPSSGGWRWPKCNVIETLLLGKMLWHIALKRDAEGDWVAVANIFIFLLEAKWMQRHGACQRKTCLCGPATYAYPYFMSFPWVWFSGWKKTPSKSVELRLLMPCALLFG